MLSRYFAYAMRHFGPQYEAMAEAEKRELFTGFLPEQEEPIRLLEVGAGTLPNSVYYTRVSLGFKQCCVLLACVHAILI